MNKLLGQSVQIGEMIGERFCEAVIPNYPDLTFFSRRQHSVHYTWCSSEEHVGHIARMRGNAHVSAIA